MGTGKKYRNRPAKRKEDRPVKRWLARHDLGLLFSVLTSLGYRIIALVVRDGAIVFESVSSPEELPEGIRDQQQAGHYSLTKDDSTRLFSWNTGPQALKPLLFKPEQPLWTCRADDSGLDFRQSPLSAEKTAVIGIRACDLAALSLQDRHFVSGAYKDDFYQAQREKLLLVAVNCSTSTENCFCVSTGTGPSVSFYHDLVMDELDNGFMLEHGSDKGLEVMECLDTEAASSEQITLAANQVRAAADSQKKQMPDDNQLLRLTELLADRHWMQIQERCLSCGNCTLVCPTCFCSRQESRSEIDSEHLLATSQVRLWDSCFSTDHAYIAGKNFRPSVSSRYRQWVIHKLVTWQSQYGSSGCVGCGRCTTWCPVAIDLVEEVSRLVSILPGSDRDSPEKKRGTAYE